jgi:hypothetical protein
MATNRKVNVDVESFVRAHDVFSLGEATAALAHPSGKDGVRNSLRYYLRLGRLKSVARGVYASIPPTAESATFQPDRYLVAAKARADAVFSYHAAFELLGAAHSDWNVNRGRASPTAMIARTWSRPETGCDSPARNPVTSPPRG